MKKIILMVSLFAAAPVHAFAYSCLGYHHISVMYYMSNLSEYEISLTFDEAEHGENPSDGFITVPPWQIGTGGIGCSSGAGYETRATLSADKDGTKFDLAYLYIDDPFSGAGRFSYLAYSIHSPECSCQVGVGKKLSGVKFYDCTSYSGPMTLAVVIHIQCE